MFVIKKYCYRNVLLYVLLYSQFSDFNYSVKHMFDHNFLSRKEINEIKIFFKRKIEYLRINRRKEKSNLFALIRN